MAPSLIRVAILDDYQGVSLSSADWSSIQDSVAIDVFRDTLNDEDRLVERLESYEVVCAMRERTKFTASLLDRLPKLRLIATTGMRNAGIDIAYARTKGIMVSGTGNNTASTLEHIWALILSVVRFVAIEDAAVKSSDVRWQSTLPLGLADRTLGLVGVGRLGSLTANIAKAFQMRVIGWSPNLTSERAEAAGVEYVSSKEELLRQSDVVSLHLVLSDRTRHIITARDFALMKSTAFLINTSRGPLVDEAALIEALQRGSIAGAGLDVFDVEPLPLDHPLRRLKNVTLSPHMGYVADTSYKTFWNETVENIEGYLNGAPKRVL